MAKGKNDYKKTPVSSNVEVENTAPIPIPDAIEESILETPVFVEHTVVVEHPRTIEPEPTKVVEEHFGRFKESILSIPYNLIGKDPEMLELLKKYTNDVIYSTDKGEMILLLAVIKRLDTLISILTTEK